VVDAFRRAGHTVRNLARRAVAGEMGSAVEWVAGDVTRAEDVSRAMRRVDAVVHLAACVRRVSRDPNEYERVNVHGAAHVATEAERRGIRLVYASTFLALGPSAPGSVARETGPFAPFPRPLTPYAASKREALHAVLERIRRGADIVVTVPCVLYGPGPAREANYTGELLTRLVRGRLPALPAGGRTRLTWAWRDDVAAAHVAAVERGRTGAMYLLGGPVVSVREVVTHAAEIAGVRPPWMNIPLAPLEFTGALAEVVYRLGGPRPAWTRAEIATYRADWAYDSSAAESELGYRPMPLASGLARALESLGVQTIASRT
jgi:nucleoside-diphosphate-sugar epimerase